MINLLSYVLWSWSLSCWHLAVKVNCASSANTNHIPLAQLNLLKKQLSVLDINYKALELNPVPSMMWLSFVLYHRTYHSIFRH